MKNCKVYREDVPQNFTVPCFMVTLYDQNPSRGINGRLKIEDKVLHFMFDVDYREYLEDSTPQMQSMIQNEEIKEE